MKEEEKEERKKGTAEEKEKEGREKRKKRKKGKERKGCSEIKEPNQARAAPARLVARAGIPIGPLSRSAKQSEIVSKLESRRSGPENRRQYQRLQ